MSLFSALSVGASGMAAQRARAELLVENLANAETTRTPEGGPYRRKDVVFESASTASPFSSVFDAQLESPPPAWRSPMLSPTRATRSAATCRATPTPIRTAIVAFPHINPAEDMVDLMGSARTL